MSVKRKVANGGGLVMVRTVAGEWAKPSKSVKRGKNEPEMPLITITPRKGKRDKSAPPAALAIITPRKGKREKNEHETVRRVRNPADITTIIESVCLTAGVVRATSKGIELIKLWIEDRKARKIKIKKGEIELQIEGGASEKDIARVVNQFKALTREMDNEKSRIILPPGVDRSLVLKPEPKEEKSFFKRR